MTDYFVEIRAAVRRSGPPRLVPLADVHKYTGFRSTFAYDKEVADMIAEQGGTQGLRGVPVYADVLLMDFDGHDPAEFRTWLAQSGLGYSEWDSGNRSYHFHIDLAPLYGAHVPSTIKAWTKKHAPTADTSFLHPSGQYRLPGTYHWKQPGKTKTLILKREGVPLHLEEAVVSEPGFSFTTHSESRPEDFYAMLLCAKGEGHRRPWLWRLGTQAAEAGLNFEDAVEHLRWWNEQFCEPPHDDLIIQQQCESAYRRLLRRNTSG